MTVEDETRDEAAERRDATAEPASTEVSGQDVDDDDDVDAHVWRAQT